MEQTFKYLVLANGACMGISIGCVIFGVFDTLEAARSHAQFTHKPLIIRVEFFNAKEEE